MSERIAENEDDEGLEPILFDHEQIYTDVVLPKLKELVVLLKECEIDYVIQLCYSHAHENGGCQHGAAILVDVDPAKSPLSMAASVVITKMNPEQAYRVMKIAEATQEAIDRIEAGEFNPINDDPWQASAPMN